MQDAWRAYLELASGLTEASRKRATKVAKDLFGKGGATAAQVQTAAQELVATSRANRETLSRLVRYEVDRALGAVGLATAEEVGELTARVQDLERRLRQKDAGGAATGPAKATGPATATEAATATARKTAAKKTMAKQTAAKQTAAKQTAAKKTAARPAVAKQATATAKKTAAKKTMAKKTAADSGSAGS